MPKQTVEIPEEWLRPRPVAQWFAGAMEHKLQVNDHKGGWRGTGEVWMIRKLLEEVGELIEAEFRWLWGHGSKEEVLLEAADVGNCAMMLADMAYYDEGQGVEGTGRDGRGTSENAQPRHNGDPIYQEPPSFYDLGGRREDD